MVLTSKEFFFIIGVPKKWAKFLKTTLYEIVKKSII